ncbi:MAG: hypothetical protein A2189_09685 [Paenibacillus sp. RIFOXYA1_FULL_44_5]|nr:MAG: hypothetical protein A2189_09685 [Paenibacillus sp. RIFOXYA1_FULL_44_5]
MADKNTWHVNGFLALLVSILSLFAGTYLIIKGAQDPSQSSLFYAAAACYVVFIVIVSSFVVVQPNQASIITFFGKYMGTIRDNGFWMALPFTVKTKISLKVRNFTSETLKVNDREGNPIEIGAVIVFKVVNPARAIFDVDSYEKFVQIQSETALRHVYTKYPYDTFSEEENDDSITLRGNPDEVADELLKELQGRLNIAGVEIMETRLTHLAYSSEIANAMLQRQQAMAIIAARQKIVEGAVGMVDNALRILKEKGLELDDERKAAMVNNLMVAIVSDRGASPIINTGSLY